MHNVALIHHHRSGVCIPKLLLFLEERLGERYVVYVVTQCCVDGCCSNSMSKGMISTPIYSRTVFTPYLKVRSSLPNLDLDRSGHHLDPWSLR